MDFQVSIPTIRSGSKAPLDHISETWYFNTVNGGHDIFTEGFSFYSIDQDMESFDDNRKKLIKDIINLFKISHENCRIFTQTNEILIITNSFKVFACIHVNDDKRIKIGGIISSIFQDTTDIKKLFLDNYQEKITGISLDWFYNTANGIKSKLSYLTIEKKSFDEMYPFLNEETLENYYSRYHESDTSILLLQGPPGTGKTTFIKNLLQHVKANVTFTTDMEVFSSESFLINFMNNWRSKYLVFEDADAYLKSRDSGNKVLHKFLSVGDGLVSKIDKKIIFTTNLENLTDIDPALTRPGRCFDILQFRPLNYKETTRLLAAIGQENNMPKGDYTIAEIFNNQTNTSIKKKEGIGFKV
jgi:hypothetical protein